MTIAICCHCEEQRDVAIRLSGQEDLMLVSVTTPVKPHHKAMLEAAAAGRCRIVYGMDETADVIIGEHGPEALRPARNLKWFHLVWAGADRYRPTDFPAGCLFTNGSGAYGVTIAEHMMACILALYRQLRHYDQLQKAHIWNGNWQEDTLEGKTVLILGAGDIGSALAKRLRGFDCTVIGLRRTAGSLPGFDQMYTLEDLDRMLPQADIVAGCLPGTGQTKGLLNETRLRAMKPGALLVNCGRGNLIDTKALERVLLEGHLGGCGLDVVDPEPLPADSPLWDLDQVILTPHISGASFGHVQEMEDRIYRLAAENLRRYLAGEELLNQVDFETGYRKR